MFGHRIAFESPAYLILLAALPLLGWWSLRSLAALGRWQRAAAIAARSLVLLLTILALAELQWVRVSDRLTVIYLLDQSLSIPETQRKAMIDWVNQEVRRQRRNDDRAGVIVFARSSAIEIPPFDDRVQLGERLESLLNPQFDPRNTNLAAALKLAQATFPEDAARRIVLVSDGNQNLGDALRQARSVVETGVGIDVAPVRYQARSEVLVEKVSLPADVREGQPFDLRVVVNNTAPAALGEQGTVAGTLRVRLLGEGEPRLISEQAVRLRPGTQVFTLRQTLTAPDFYQYEAQFVPDDPRDDAVPQNNRATTFTQIRGKGQALVIVDHEGNGEADQGPFIEALKRQQIETRTMLSSALFDDLADLQRYDTVILANVPRERFSDRQIETLVRNTEQMGAGLVMLGGANSFGAGGWTNSTLEKAMPVDFQIHNAKVEVLGALAIVMHASEMPEGNFWQAEIAKKAIEALGNNDYCGLISWDGNIRWLWGQPQGMIQVGPNRNLMLGRVNKMVPGDMPDFDPGLELAVKSFQKLPVAAAKHMIVISDGDPTPPSAGVVNQLKAAGVTVSTVAVASHGALDLRAMQNLALATKGKFYQVNQGNALPKIIQREARRVARPLLFFRDEAFPVAVANAHEITAGLGKELPALNGFVMTSPKLSELAETIWVSTQPAGRENNTLLAAWTYGLGKTAVFTSDTGSQWAKEWRAWPGYDKFFGQLVRWSMRPITDQGKFTVALDARDGKVQVVVTALDQKDEFLNDLDIAGTVVGPGMQPEKLRLEQAAPGRYVGQFEGAEPGSYFLNLNPGPGMAPIRTGVTVPYSAEFLAQESNAEFLLTLATLTPKAGQPGVVYEGVLERVDETRSAAGEGDEALNPFRHDLPRAESSQEMWPWLLLLAGTVFFGDVFVRRVQIEFGWLWAAMDRGWRFVLRREPPPVRTVAMERLKSRKQQVAGEIEQRRGAARFEPEASSASEDAVRRALGEVSGAAPPAADAPPPAAVPEEDSPTERLLKTKRKLWDGKEPK